MQSALRAAARAAAKIALGGVAFGASACASEIDASPEPTYREVEALATGDAQKLRLCGRGNSDVVIDTFCARRTPRIESVIDLRNALGLGSGEYSTSMYQGFALTGHSTSLVSRSVSAINPRAIFIQPEDVTTELRTMAFARGEQFSEIAVRDRLNGELQFYLVTFTQDCNEAPDGCTPGDLLTEAAESSWKNVNVYGEEDLANTPSDCRVCHQPDGPGSRKFLRMQELEPPWNHWFYALVPGGRAVIADYLAAKGDEGFAGLLASEVANGSQPGVLSSTLFFADSGDQPNAFVSARIEREVEESAAARGGDQPDDNSIPGESETWEAIYERSKRGDAIPVPYHDVKVTDPSKLAIMTQAYTDYREGRLPREELPDLRDIYPDDPELLARMGFATEPGLDGEGVLMQACAQCHNDRLDQSVSRARFNVDLDRLDTLEKQRAIARIRLPLHDPGVMPPALSRRLDDDAKQQLIELLER